MNDMNKQLAHQMAFGALRALAPYLNDPFVTEIMVNGEDDVYIEKRGAQEKTDVKISNMEISSAISIIASADYKMVRNGTNDAIVSGKLPGGFRVESLVPPAAVDGPTMCIRRHASHVFTLEQWVEQGAVPQHLADEIRNAVLRRENILIAGSTGSGKTTFMNTAIQMITQTDRVISIEVVPELQIHAPNKVRFEVNNAMGITARVLLQSTLRFLPSRILMGEVRGAEAYDFLQMANTGHDGCIGTLHANNCIDTLTRFTDLCLEGNSGLSGPAISRRIAATFKYIVYLKKIGRSRYLTELVKVLDFDTQNERFIVERLYTREETND